MPRKRKHHVTDWLGGDFLAVYTMVRMGRVEGRVVKSDDYSVVAGTIHVRYFAGNLDVTETVRELRIAGFIKDELVLGENGTMTSTLHVARTFPPPSSKGDQRV